MYADPTLIRDNVVKIRLNDLEDDLVTAWVNFRGGQKATFLRELLIEAAMRDMGLDAAGNPLQAEVPQMSLLRA